MQKIILTIVFYIICFAYCITGTNAAGRLPENILINKDSCCFNRVDDKWVDSVFNSLTADEKIAQLMFIQVYSNSNEEYYSKVSELITKYNVGGVAFFQGGPVMQARLTNRWQKNAKTPLLVSVDGEWGLGMRLKDSAVSFPRQMTLGAIRDDSLIYKMGVEIAKQMKRIGVHINFAPVLDINNNPANPVINSRSFGEDKYNVTRKAIMYMKGMQDNGILAVGKHFPGHGDTQQDSHETLPLMYHDKSMIDTFDLYPYKELFKNGLNSVMVAHLYIPAVDTTKGLASSLSPLVIKGLLKNELKFDGLIITDGLAMKGVADFFKSGALEVKALQAGNDVLLLPENIPAAITAIKQAITDSVLMQADIDAKCKKVLAYKSKLGLAALKPVDENNLYNDIKNVNSDLLNRKLYQSAITLVKNNKNLLPLKKLDTLKLASVSLGVEQNSQFQNMMNNYAAIDCYNLCDDANMPDVDSLICKLGKYNIVVVGIHNTNQSANDNYGISFEQVKFIEKLKQKTKIVLTLFSNPYSLNLFKDTSNIESVIVAYQENIYTQEASAQIIFGGLPVSGTLPVTANKNFPLGTGIILKDVLRFNYTIPEDLGINSDFENKVDSLINSAIADTTFPGCQVFYAYDGKVFLNKSYGRHTYDTKSKIVENSDLYDVASLTKVVATTIAIMKLYEKGKINIDKSLGDYLSFLHGTNKSKLKIRPVMAHQAGLKPWIPFYLNTLSNGMPDERIYRSFYTDSFPIKVADKLYIRKDYPDIIYKSIASSDLLPGNKYNYSDLGFILLKLIVEKLSGANIENYLYAEFYKPLGLSTTCFNPLRKYNINRIAPTENDIVFRKQLIHGYVHDPCAAMLGGVAGHAGVFSNANDIGVLLQMLLQEGIYADKVYLKNSTIKEFTSFQYPKNNNRRGLGFDKPFADINKRQTCKSASLNSYGHSGFTGTYFWVDPDYKYVFVFLSNRVYPDATNEKLRDNNIRTNLHQLGYDAIKQATGK